MNAIAIIGFLKLLGSLAGALTAIIAFIALISKRPKKWFRNTIREEANNANQDIKNQISKLGEKTDSKLCEIDQKIQAAEENDLAILRNTITHIYFKYKDNKKIPHYEKENVLSLYERYEALHGNHYVKSIMKEIEGWEEII